jgi:hypothetical protein
MQTQDLTIPQDMEPKSIDLTFIVMKSKNLIQNGCRSGITSDDSKNEYMSYYKMISTIQNNPPNLEYILKTRYNEN